MDNIYRQNVYSFAQEMWHSKGRVGKERETCVEVYSQMDQVTYVKEEFAAHLNGSMVGSGFFMIKRIDSSGREVIIGNTKDCYEILQPMQYAELYDLAVGQPCETMGFLGTNAEKMFITHCLPDIDIYGDPMKLYNLLSVGFDGKYGEHQHVVRTRVVCQNTETVAIREAEQTKNQGRGDLYVGRHNNPNHIRDLKAWLSLVQKSAVETVEMTKNLFCKMEETPLTVDQAFGLTQEIYPNSPEIPAFFPEELRSEKQEKIDKENEKAQETRELVMNLFQGAGIEIAPTCYGFYNANTEMANHHMASKKDFAYSVLLGNRANMMNRATGVITNYVNNLGK
jgi:hypothetical protein